MGAIQVSMRRMISAYALSSKIILTVWTVGWRGAGRVTDLGGEIQLETEQREVIPEIVERQE